MGVQGSLSLEGRWARRVSRLAFWGRGVQLGRAFTSLLSSSPLLAIRQRKGLANLQRSKCTLGGLLEPWGGGGGSPGSATGMGESLGTGRMGFLRDRGLPMLHRFRHLPSIQKCQSQVPWWGDGHLPAPRSPEEGAQAPQHPCPAWHGWEMSFCQGGTQPWIMAGFGLLRGIPGMGQGGVPGRWQLPTPAGSEPCHECVGSQRGAPCAGKPEADDAKARAVQEMMERIKHGVVLRPAKERDPLGQVGRDPGSATAGHPHPMGECPWGAPGLGMGLGRAGSPGELQGWQDAATSPLSSPAGSGGGGRQAEERGAGAAGHPGEQPCPKEGGVTPGHRAGTRMPSSPAAAVLRGAASGLSWPAPGGPSAWMWPPQHLGSVGGFLGCHEEGEQEAQRAAKQPEGQGQAAGVHPAAATPGGGCLCTLTAHPRPPAAGP